MNEQTPPVTEPAESPETVIAKLQAQLAMIQATKVTAPATQLSHDVVMLGGLNAILELVVTEIRQKANIPVTAEWKQSIHCAVITRIAHYLFSIELDDARMVRFLAILQHNGTGANCSQFQKSDGPLGHLFPRGEKASRLDAARLLAK